MKKYLIALILTALFAIPPLLGNVTLTWRSDVWAYLVFFISAGAFFSLYLRINIWIKLLTIWLLISCYLSQMPVVSFTSYINYIGALIFYLICVNSKLEDLRFVFKTFPVLFLFEIMILCFQHIDPDILLKSLDLGKDVKCGSVSNTMMFGSMLIVLSAGLVFNKRWYIIPAFMVFFLFPDKLQIHRCMAPFLYGVMFYLYFKFRHKKIVKWLFIISFIISSVLLFNYKKKELFTEGHRGPIWVRTIEMTIDRCWRGWGLGTYQILMPLNSEDIAGGWTESFATKQEKWRIGQFTGKHIMWRRAHNDPLQFYFASGNIGLFLFLGLIGWIILRFKRKEKTDELLLSMSGLIAIGLNSLETYPFLMIQLGPAIMFLLAYFTKLTEVKREY